MRRKKEGYEKATSKYMGSSVFFTDCANVPIGQRYSWLLSGRV